MSCGAAAATRTTSGRAPGSTGGLADTVANDTDDELSVGVLPVIHGRTDTGQTYRPRTLRGSAAGDTRTDRHGSDVQTENSPWECCPETHGRTDTGQTYRQRTLRGRAAGLTRTDRHRLDAQTENSPWECCRRHTDGQTRVRRTENSPWGAAGDTRKDRHGSDAQTENSPWEGCRRHTDGQTRVRRTDRELSLGVLPETHGRTDTGQTYRHRALRGSIAGDTRKDRHGSDVQTDNSPWEYCRRHTDGQTRVRRTDR